MYMCNTTVDFLLLHALVFVKFVLFQTNVQNSSLFQRKEHLTQVKLYPVQYFRKKKS